MIKTAVLGGLLATALAIPALAQSNPPANAPANTTEPRATTVSTAAPIAAGSVWRASKLKGLNVYNEQNEKLGDINEILLDKPGRVTGVVIGVGGFLGMGEHDIMVDMNKLKFVDEPVRTSATAANTTGAATNNNRPATTSTATTNADHKWYPDHAILAGATKDSLKSMPQFKYD
jgi:sporulation protein YlmC with PRC-barrel domain